MATTTKTASTRGASARAASRTASGSTRSASTRAHNGRAAASGARGAAPSRGTAHSGRRAAVRAGEKNSVRLELPCVGAVTLPSTDQLAFLGGVATLAAVGIIEWPVAALLGVGHLLAASRGNRVLRDFGEALEEA